MADVPRPGQVYRCHPDGERGRDRCRPRRHGDTLALRSGGLYPGGTSSRSASACCVSRRRAQACALACSPERACELRQTVGRSPHARACRHVGRRDQDDRSPDAPAIRANGYYRRRRQAPRVLLSPVRLSSVRLSSVRLSSCGDRVANILRPDRLPDSRANARRMAGEARPRSGQTSTTARFIPDPPTTNSPR